MKSIIIEWDDRSIDHIGCHQVEPEEVEEVIKGRHLLNKGKHGSRYIFGQTEAGRYLFIIIARKSSGYYQVVTARDMTTSERKRYKNKGKIG